jgi:hypothetical protein
MSEKALVIDADEFGGFSRDRVSMTARYERSFWMVSALAPKCSEGLWNLYTIFYH